MSCKVFWKDLCKDLCLTPSLFNQGNRQIHRNKLVTNIPYKEFNDLTNFQLEDIYYTPVKLTHLKRYYLDMESLEKACSIFIKRIEKSNRNSATIILNGKEKNFSPNDFCILGAVLTNNGKYWDITFQYRTTEALYKFRGDLVFFNQVIFPLLSERLNGTNPEYINFFFPNIVINPMYLHYWLYEQKSVTKMLIKLQKKNPKLHESYLKLVDYHMGDTVYKFMTAQKIRNWLDKKPKFIEEIYDYKESL